MIKRVAIVLLVAATAFAQDRTSCRYVDNQGVIRTAKSMSEIPESFRYGARCETVKAGEYLAKPEEVTLEGNVRREDMNSPLGRIQLRWPRKVESLFGRTPSRATADAARTVSAALRNGGFPTSLQRFSVDWQIVFLDADLPETQIPAFLIDNCHPGWMTPPGNIYIVAQRVAGGCGGQKVARGVADSVLAEVMIHEMGHAVEAQLLGPHFYSDRVRAEGFATWFEMFAARHSSILNGREVVKRVKATAKESFMRNPNNFSFSGTDADYCRVAMYFEAVADRSGVRGLMDVYELMAMRGVSFNQAVETRMRWKPKQLDENAREVAGVK